MEQPASRNSAPAARNTSSNPSSIACFFTCCDPGTTSTRTFGFTLRPLITEAAARRSEMREFVQLPINTTSIGCPARGLPGSSAMYFSAFSRSERSIGSAIDAGVGNRP